MRSSRTQIAHLGSTTSDQPLAAAAAWLSRNADLVTAAAAFAGIYFLLIRKQ